jgi:retinoblastoma-like protein 1
LLVHSGVANDAGEITLIPISMNSSQESKVESPVSLTAQSLIGTSPKQTHLTKAPEVHLTGISKPKRTGSLALFYRKVRVFIASQKSSFNQLQERLSNREQLWLFFFFLIYVT